MGQTGCKYLEREWVDLMTKNIRLLHPDDSEDRIRKFVKKKFQERFKDTECSIFNSYENTVTNTSLGETLDWIDSYHPIMSESGVFFYPKHLKRNVNIEIIKEDMLDRRAKHKKEKFDCMERGDVFGAAVKDLLQANDKKAANSGYGAEGQSSSFLYNINSAMSVTAAGRGQLSTMILCFENLFADNVKFWSMDEFHNHLSHILNEENEWKYETFKILDRLPSKKSWVRRFKGKFLHHSLYNESMIEAIYDGLTDEQRARTYYKCNLREFLYDNHTPTNLFQKIIDRKDLHNKKGNPMDFVDPNEIPVELVDDLNTLSSMVVEFVGYKYSQARYEDKARYMRRKAVGLFDTDS